MRSTYAWEQQKPNCTGDCGTGEYNYSVSRVEANGVRTIIGRMGLTVQATSKNGTTYTDTYGITGSKYITEKESKKIEPSSVGKLTLIK